MVAGAEAVETFDEELPGDESKPKLCLGLISPERISSSSNLTSNSGFEVPSGKNPVPKQGI